MKTIKNKSSKTALQSTESEVTNNEPISLSNLGHQFVLHWGEMGSQWGINRTVAQIHALLFYQGTPMNAEQIAETLMIARSNVSNSLKELQNWNLIQVTHILGDRRDYFSTSLDTWQLFRTVVTERKTREFDPTVTFLKRFLANNDFKHEDKATKKRVEDILDLMQTLSIWGDEMIRLDPKVMVKIMKYGAKIQTLIRGNN